MVAQKDLHNIRNLRKVIAIYKINQFFPKGTCPLKLETSKKYLTQKVALPDFFYKHLLK